MRWSFGLTARRVAGRVCGVALVKGHAAVLSFGTVSLGAQAMIGQLSLSNFKSWRKISGMRLAPFTGLFGSNSSGKTSILQFLLMLKQTVESPDRKQVLNFGDERTLVGLGSFQEVVHGHDVSEPMAWSFFWDLPKAIEVSDPEQKRVPVFSGKRMGFEAQVGQNQAGRRTVAKMAYHFAEREFGMKQKPNKPSQYDLYAKPSDFKFKRFQGRAWALPEPSKCYGFPDQVRGYFQNAQFLADFQLALEDLFKHIYYLGPLREYPKRQYPWIGEEPADMGPRGEKVIEALLASRVRGKKISRGKGHRRFSVEEYVAYWLHELRLIDSFRVERIAKDSNLYQVWVKKSPSAAEVLITDVGFGVSQILPVLAICYYVPEGSTVLLEQPEIHLHPSVQAGLADVFRDAIEKRKVQIILESHSEHLLRRIQRRLAESDNGLGAQDVELYFCDEVGGRSRLVRLDVDMYGNIANWPRDFFGDEFGEMAAMAEAQLERQKAQQR